jgi:Ca2+-binding RTX toxin-like protein
LTGFGREALNSTVEFEGAVGSFFGDSLSGNAFDNFLFGFEGDDTINGLDGDDLIVGAAGPTRPTVGTT